ncbi:MAG: hypothetical protein ABF665_17745, partial [Gluconacetobacter sp.]
PAPVPRGLAPRAPPSELGRPPRRGGGQATPMSYEVGGKQYVLIAAGGHGGLGTRSGDYIIAYTLDGAQGTGATAQ